MSNFGRNIIGSNCRRNNRSNTRSILSGGGGVCCGGGGSGGECISRQNTDDGASRHNNKQDTGFKRPNNVADTGQRRTTTNESEHRRQLGGCGLLDNVFGGRWSTNAVGGLNCWACDSGQSSNSSNNNNKGGPRGGLSVVTLQKSDVYSFSLVLYALVGKNGPWGTRTCHYSHSGNLIYPHKII